MDATRAVTGWLAFSSWDDTEIDGLAVLVRSAPNGRYRRTILRPPEGLGVFSEAHWSTDGTKIAVTLTLGNRYTGYSSDVSFANADGTGRRRLVPGPHAERA